MPIDTGLILAKLESMEDKLDANCADTLAIKKWAMGDLESPEEKPGMNLRMDRVEQTVKTGKWAGVAITGGLLASLGSWLWGLINGGAK